MGKGILLNEWRNGLCFLSWKKNPQMHLVTFDWLLCRDPRGGSMNWLLLGEWLADSDSASVERNIISRLQNTYTVFMCPMCIPMDRGHLQMKISETNELLVLHVHLDRLNQGMVIHLEFGTWSPNKTYRLQHIRPRSFGNVCRVPAAQLNIEGISGFQSLKC